MSHMFKSLTDLKIERDQSQAFGFYLTYGTLIVAASTAIDKVLYSLGPDWAAYNSPFIGNGAFATILGICLLVSFVTRAKHFTLVQKFFCLLTTFIISVISIVFGLMFAAFCTTRKQKLP